MSCSYAEGLSPYPNKGQLGMPERFADEMEVTQKVAELAAMMKASRHTVFHTGAGISTSAGIPDFRGPKGVWTLEKKGLKPEVNVSFDDATPTFTHMALVALENAGLVHYIVSQNIDGLHLRSGFPRKKLAELHGNMYIDKCSVCKREFVRSHATKTVGQKLSNDGCVGKRHTGRKCRGRLHDNILDWEHDLPHMDYYLAEKHAVASDLNVCLGTTLQIVPSGMLPTISKQSGGKLVICNLQPTKHDKIADIIINCYVDDLMRELLKVLNISCPEYSVDKDPVHVTRALRLSDNTEPFEWTIPEEWFEDADLVEKVKRNKAIISATSTSKRNSRKGLKGRKRRRSPVKHEVKSEASTSEEFKVEQNEPMDVEDVVHAVDNEVAVGGSPHCSVTSDVKMNEAGIDESISTSQSMKRIIEDVEDALCANKFSKIDSDTVNGTLSESGSSNDSNRLNGGECLLELETGRSVVLPNVDGGQQVSSSQQVCFAFDGVNTRASVSHAVEKEVDKLSNGPSDQIEREDLVCENKAAKTVLLDSCQLDNICGNLLFSKQESVVTNSTELRVVDHTNDGNCSVTDNNRQVTNCSNAGAGDQQVVRVCEMACDTGPVLTDSGEQVLNSQKMTDSSQQTTGNQVTDCNRHLTCSQKETDRIQQLNGDEKVSDCCQQLNDCEKVTESIGVTNYQLSDNISQQVADISDLESNICQHSTGNLQSTIKTLENSSKFC